VRLLEGFSHSNPDIMADFGGWAMRKIGPRLKEHKIARDNLVAAFPEKFADEIDTILSGVWDNLGRLGTEIAHLDQMWDFDISNPNRPSRGEIAPEVIERIMRLAVDGKPALVFSAHLANWELAAVAAAKAKLKSAALYRPPNNAAIDRWIRKTRTASMGSLIPSGFDTPMRIMNALREGTHVGMLVDQHYGRGVAVDFFGRRALASPLLARLAQHFDCPIHGARIIRLPGHRFRAELTEEIAPVRDVAGKVDIAGTMQVITKVVEGWIREHPEQWLWLHRRWRPQDGKGDR
jgi:KDO2-lipid IV(A) lauroyltransferase